MKDMGRVMALVKERLGTSIEPARASALVKAALSKTTKKAPPRGAAEPIPNASDYIAVAAFLPARAPVRPVTPSITSP